MIPIFANDFERFACDIIQAVLDSGNYKPTEALIQRVGRMLEYGPLITVWPADVAEAAQRARDRARARLVAPVPTLPRVPVVLPPTLPRVPVVLPRVVIVAPILPRVVLK